MSFFSETDIKAVRKRHRCAGCGKNIEIGEPAFRWTGTTDGEFDTATYHPECRKAEIALNELLLFQDGDDWGALIEIDDEDRPWLIETFPTVAARMGFAPSSQTEADQLVHDAGKSSPRPDGQGGGA